ncbi:integrase core domain-containing protein [Kosakonia cowanii]|uniref:integrase core domain-containing protein n=1 Tax=Kosakonia cowanii TaxID=208223 RepID=UPI003EE74D4C
MYARKLINDRRKNYNLYRPHSSLNYLTPAEFTRVGELKNEANKPPLLTDYYLIVGVSQVQLSWPLRAKCRH